MGTLRGVIVSAAMASALLSDVAFSQEPAGAYPSRVVTWIASYAAGGPNDQETRLYAAKLSGLLGQQFIVDYKAGAGGAVAYAYVAKSAPDGYTMLIATGSFTVIPSLYKDLSFDTLRDFAPVSLMSKRASLLVVPPSFPARTFAEYIAYARKNPGKINVATSGAGGLTHLAIALVHSLTNTSVTYVHYKGVGPMMPDLLAGRVDIASVALLSSLPLIKSGKLRALAITDDKRSKLAPDVPTVAEQGIAEYAVPNWLGYLAPAATPAAIVNRMGDAFATVARAPDIASPLEAQGTVLHGIAGAPFRQFLAAETAMWRKVIQENGIKLEE